MSDMSGLSGLEQKISETLRAYCRVPSISNTPSENLVPAFFRQCLEDTPYFRAHPDYLGAWEIEDDPLNRKLPWAMIRGGSERTVVLIHHCDVVVTDNYGPLRDLAFDLDNLAPALKDHPDLLSPEARADLASGEWLFGRGAADMKGGGAIQIALFDTYARLTAGEREALPTLVLMALPDEENLSAGMRGGLGLLCHLAETYGLSYDLMINSEPHQRKTPERGLISQGSIGKLNLFVYVRGVPAHAGKALEGLNPTGLMSEIAAQTDLSDLFVDQEGDEVSIPPTWIMLRDLKKQYDVTFPEASYGVFNVLNFRTGPSQVMSMMTDICKRTLREYIERINRKRAVVSQKTGQEWAPFDWTARVISFGELKSLTPAPSETMPLEEELACRTRGLYPEEPLIVVGLCPPYYPGVANPDQKPLHDKVRHFTRERFSQDYDNQAYYTGISDLSYAMAAGDTASLSNAMEDMAGEGYHIPFDRIEKISMNCINLGPWGKDFHKPSERVLKEDLFRRTPLLVDHIIRTYNVIRNHNHV